MELVLYEDKVKYGLGVKFGIGFAVAFILVCGFLSYYGVFWETEAEPRKRTIFLFASTLLIPLFFWTIFPQKYQILEDHIKIVLGKLFFFNIPFETAKAAKKGGWNITMGISFVGSMKNPIVIERIRGNECGNFTK